MKFKVLYAILFSLIFSLNTSAQEICEDSDEDATQIIAAMDSLTWLLQNDLLKEDRNYLHPDSLDFSACGVLPGFDPAIIQSRMNSLESAIPLVYNQYVKGFIDLYGRKKSPLTSKILTLSEYYFPIFEEILDQEGLPLEFKYLAVVESALNPKAMSWAGASGLWQFIHSTGLRYGLRINSYVDERRDVIKSTKAACQYFKDSYALYGDWLLVIASYNCGPGNVNKAIRKSGGKKNFWAIQHYLPKETRGYVPAFIAVAYVMNFHEEHGIYPTAIDMHKFIQEVELSNQVSFEQLSAALQIPLEDLEYLNPAYKRGLIPGTEGAKTINLPYFHAIKLMEVENDLYKNEFSETDSNGRVVKYKIVTEKINYKVKSGDNLRTVARKFGCEPSDLKEWNVIKNNTLRPGRVIAIYRDVKKPVYEDNPSTPSVPDLALDIKPGETKSPEQPQKSNNNTTLSKDNYVYYKVAPGDTLYSISKKYEGVTVDQIKALNNLDDASVIKPGETIKIKIGG